MIIKSVLLAFILSSFANCWKNRNDIGDILQRKSPKFKIGVEVGVQYGLYSKEILKRWSNCEKFYLVDAWQQLENYHDSCNVDNAKQVSVMEEAKRNTAFAKDKVVMVKSLSTEAAKKFALEGVKFDFIYIDARHDYCGVKEDIEAYYPLLNDGGIISGHDYGLVPSLKGDDFNVCANGSYIPGAVKRAVNEFVKEKDLDLHLIDSSWIAVKKGSKL